MNNKTRYHLDNSYITNPLKFGNIRLYQIGRLYCESSQIISEDDATITVQYGSGITSCVSTSDVLPKINMASMMGKMIETNRKITIFLSKDGTKIRLRVFKNQQTVDLTNMENCDLKIQGRHDPCIVIRAVPVVEAVMSIGIMDMVM